MGWPKFAVGNTSWSDACAIASEYHSATEALLAARKQKTGAVRSRDTLAFVAAAEMEEEAMQALRAAHAKANGEAPK